MFLDRAERWTCLLIVGVLFALVMVIAGCGDDGEQTSATADDARPAQGSVRDLAQDEKAIRTVYGQFVDASYNGPPRVICDLMTSRAKRMLQLAGDTARTDCLRFFSQSLADQQTGTATYPKPIVLAVEVKGSRAIARVKTPGSTGGLGPGTGGLTRVRFTEEGGEWKVDGDVDMGPL